MCLLQKRVAEASLGTWVPDAPGPPLVAMGPQPPSQPKSGDQNPSPEAPGVMEVGPGLSQSPVATAGPGERGHHAPSQAVPPL